MTTRRRRRRKGWSLKKIEDDLIRQIQITQFRAIALVPDLHATQTSSRLVIQTRHYTTRHNEGRSSQRVGNAKFPQILIVRTNLDRFKALNNLSLEADPEAVSSNVTLRAGRCTQSLNGVFGCWWWWVMVALLMLRLHGDLMMVMMLTAVMARPITTTMLK
ncbi:hypothetical protein PoB_000334000 [Plakobranchus ocellatus]|uniref:Uncharacterized protein n=1 Tax=Plakobranchus ocellatus TaxID=259542 RepID=A0AAV3Y186_9GAST|nr:hypothetical protein PoB_000334000 [Plakobranchus ocellatus]